MTENDIADIRFAFIEKYLVSSINLKNDNWVKFLGAESGQKALLQFFDGPRLQILFFSLSTAGALNAQSTFPSSSKSKCCFFVKTSDDPVPREGKLSDYATFGDIPVEMMASFSTFFQHASS